jgi:hypothetical protein
LEGRHHFSEAPQFRRDGKGLPLVDGLEDVFVVRADRHRRHDDLKPNLQLLPAIGLGLAVCDHD